MIPDDDPEALIMRKFELVTRDDQQRGEVTGTRADAVAAANALRERTGETVYTQPAGAVFVPADQRR